jgi:1-acyl-sn-glycerol-3-phosphate acyltransferase
MVVVRSLGYLLVMALSVVPYSFAIILAGCVRRSGWVGALGAQWSQLNLFFLRALCGLSFRVRGLENLSGTNAILLSKHQSAWETIAFLALLPRPQTWVVKRELLWVPLFGWSMALFEPIAIDRGSGRKAMRQVLAQGSRALDNGRWVILFPEGTRVAAGAHGRYGLGGAMLGEKTGRRIIPIAHNAGVFWARRDVRKYPGVVDVVIGPAVETRGRRATDINRDVEDWIEATVGGLPGSTPPM